MLRADPGPIIGNCGDTQHTHTEPSSDGGVWAAGAVLGVAGNGGPGKPGRALWMRHASGQVPGRGAYKRQTSGKAAAGLK